MGMRRKFLRGVVAAVVLAVAPLEALAGPPSGSGPPPTPTVSSSAPAFGMAWGDSLTQGNQDYSGVTLTTALTKALGLPFINGGMSGQKSTQIAMRQGGVPVQLTFSGNQLGYAQTSVTAVNGGALAGLATTQDPDYRFLSYGSGYVTVYGTVCGVHGTLGRIGTGGPPTTGESYIFTPDQFTAVTSRMAADPVACPANSVFTPDVQNPLAPTILWMGQNNPLSTQTAQVESDIDNAVSFLTGAGNQGYLVLGLFQAEYEANGGSGANLKAALNSRNASTYGAHFVDVKSILDANYNPANPVDVYDHANGIVPYTLRAVSSGGTAAAITDTVTCNLTLTPQYGQTQVNGVIKIDSEYILPTAISGNNVTTCARGYAGSTAATHAANAHYDLSDPLHVGGDADTIIANWIAANKASVLLGGLPTSVITAKSLGEILSGPMNFAGPTFFDQNLTAARGITLYNGACIYGPGTGSVGQPGTTYQNGPFQPIVCYNNGNGTLTIGGPWNTKICLTIGGTAGCLASLNAQGSLVTSGEVKTATKKTSGTSYTATATDRVIEITTGTAFAVTLMASPPTGQIVTVKDGSGAASPAITVTAMSGDIEGAASYSINIAYGKATFYYDGSQWVTL